jgi:hypothetical protein
VMPGRSGKALIETKAHHEPLAPHASLICLDLADTLLDTLRRGLVRTTADGIPMRPPNSEHPAALSVRQ